MSNFNIYVDLSLTKPTKCTKCKKEFESYFPNECVVCTKSFCSKCVKMCEICNQYYCKECGKLYNFKKDKCQSCKSNDKNKCILN